MRESRKILMFCSFNKNNLASSHIQRTSCRSYILCICVSNENSLKLLITCLTGKAQIRNVQFYHTGQEGWNDLSDPRYSLVFYNLGGVRESLDTVHDYHTYSFQLLTVTMFLGGWWVLRQGMYFPRWLCSCYWCFRNRRTEYRWQCDPSHRWRRCRFNGY